jgi:hypothetical protein
VIKSFFLLPHQGLLLLINVCLNDKNEAVDQTCNSRCLYGNSVALLYIVICFCYFTKTFSVISFRIIDFETSNSHASLNS